MAASGSTASSDILRRIKSVRAIPTSRLVHVTRHVTQEYDWDCGIACVKMVTDTPFFCDGVPCDKNFWLNVGYEQRVWTIDLSLCLEQLNVFHEFRTLTIGVDPTYEREEYYKTNFTDDQSRIEKQFRLARERRIRVEKSSTDISEIIAHLNTNNLVIVLVNSAILKCDHPTHSMNRLINGLVSNGKYHGHYLVVCGFDMENELILFRDPRYRNCICKATFAIFDEARKSHGTDEDTLLIYGLDRP